MTTERIEVRRTIAAGPAAIFGLLCDPQGHVAIDSSGMLMAATGGPVAGVGDSFVVHMDREALNDYPMGRYDVTVTITRFVPGREIAWTVLGRIRPQIGHVYGYVLEPAADGTLVTSYYDWSASDETWKQAGIFPVLSEAALRATLGILARTVARGPAGMTLRYEIFPADLDATVDFYTRVLGFTVTKDQRAGPAAYVSLARDAVRVGAARRPGGDDAPPWRPPAGAELVLEVDDVAGERDRVASAGWPLVADLQDRPWGLADFRILDPAGYYLRVTSRSP